MRPIKVLASQKWEDCTTRRGMEDAILPPNNKSLNQTYIEYIVNAFHTYVELLPLNLVCLVRVQNRNFEAVANLGQ